jgi:hypothetical protein
MTDPTFAPERIVAAMKLASGRPSDLVDVAELDELHGRP